MRAFARPMQYYGAALSLAHIVTAYYWLRDTSVVNNFSNEYGHSICWAFLPNCLDWRFFSESAARMALFAYGALAAACAGLFLWGKQARLSYFLFLGLSLSKFYLYLQSYSLMGNYHYMTFLVDWFFLFLPAAHRAIPLLIMFFYFYAGLLKLNTEWISGAAIPMEWISGQKFYRDLFLNPNLAIPFSAYGAFIELVVIFGLLSANRWIFWFAFLNIASFHAFSWGIVGYLYPCIMFCLISIYPILRFFPVEGTSIGDSAKRIFQNWRESRLTLAFFSIFMIFQSIHHIMPGDSALTVEYRMFALNMLDAKTECASSSYAHFEDRVVDLSYEKKNNNFNVRSWCEPYVYFARAKAACREFASEKGFKGISLSLLSKRTTDPNYHKVVEEDDICGLEYSVLFPNKWIRKD